MGKTIALTYELYDLNDARKPKIAVGSGDNLYVLWHDSSAAQKLSLYQIWSLDAGDDLTPVNETDILNESGSSAQNPRIATGGDDKKDQATPYSKFLWILILLIILGLALGIFFARGRISAAWSKL